MIFGEGDLWVQKKPPERGGLRGELEGSEVDRVDHLASFLGTLSAIGRALVSALATPALDVGFAARSVEPDSEVVLDVLDSLSFQAALRTRVDDVLPGFHSTHKAPVTTASDLWPLLLHAIIEQADLFWREFWVGVCELFDELLACFERRVLSSHNVTSFRIVRFGQ